MSQVGESAKLKGAPNPDDSRKPRSVRGVSWAAWKLVFRTSARGFVSHGLVDMAASLTYFALLALAPSLVALMSLSVVFGSGRSLAQLLLTTVDEVAPGSAITLIRVPLENFVKSPAVGYALVIGVLFAIWTTSSYVSAFGRSLNRIYEIDEGRPLWKLRPTQILVGLAVIALVLIIVGALVLTAPVAKGIGDALNLGQAWVVTWSIAKWPIFISGVVVTVAVLNYATPNVRQPKFRWMSEGAFITVIVLAGVSLLFSLYVSNFAQFDKTYRAFAGVVVFLLWLWIANLTLLFGAEVDAQFERARELEAGIKAENKIQLPPRDTQASERAAKRRRRDIRAGRKIRRQRDSDGEH